MAARLSPVFNNKRRPVAFRPVLANGLAFQLSILDNYNTVIQFVKLFFGAGTSDTIALLKYGHGENSGGCLTSNSR